MDKITKFNHVFKENFYALPDRCRRKIVEEDKKDLVCPFCGAKSIYCPGKPAPWRYDKGCKHLWLRQNYEIEFHQHWVPWMLGEDENERAVYVDLAYLEEFKAEHEIKEALKECVNC